MNPNIESGHTGKKTPEGIWRISPQKDWASLSEQFDWVSDMALVEQSAHHHREGNVDVHTRMVLHSLERNPEYLQLDEQAREILWAAALLHDVEKRSTSIREADGHISTTGHARRGEQTARTVLFRDIATPFAIRERIAALVRYHGLPLWVYDKDDALKQVLEASLRTDTQELLTLARADLNGRICSDTGELNERLDFFREYCIEQQCWGLPYPFASGNARFHYFSSDEVYPVYVPFDDFKSKVLMLSGLPGMGKDHYLKQQGIDRPVISLDAIRRAHRISPTDKSANGWVIQQAKEQAKEYLRRGDPFVWNATNITRQMRSQLISLFVTYNAHVTLVYIEKPYRTWISQNRNREYMVPQAVMDKMLDKLEIPLLYEAHEVVYDISEQGQ